MNYEEIKLNDIYEISELEYGVNLNKYVLINLTQDLTNDDSKFKVKDIINNGDISFSLCRGEGINCITNTKILVIEKVEN